jgi:hypothetical protein
LGELRVNRSQGLAPHKPLLLLVVLEMIDHGELATPILTLTPELAFRFSEFGTVVAHRRTQRMDVRLPFFHLSTDGVWSAFTKDGTESLDPKVLRWQSLPFYSLIVDQPISTNHQSGILKLTVPLQCREQVFGLIDQPKAFRNMVFQKKQIFLYRVLAE